MNSKGTLWIIVAGGLTLVYGAPKIAPVASDPLELATGKIQVVASANRKAMLDLPARAAITH